MKIDPDKMYSGVEVQKIAGIKSRQYISKYVKEGYLIAITTGTGQGHRYMVRGEHLQEFLNRYKKGLTNGKKYSREEIKSILEETIKKL